MNACSTYVRPNRRDRFSKFWKAALVTGAVAAAALPSAALADVMVGVLIPASGPGAGFGQQMKVAIDMLSDTGLDVGKGGKLKFEVYDTRGEVPEAMLGNVSSWAPSPPVAANTVRIDRAPPRRPAHRAAATPGRASPASVLQRAAAPRPSAARASPPTSTAPPPTAAPPGARRLRAVRRRHRRGRDHRQFRSVDKAGNVSAWAPAAPGPRHARIDRTAADRAAVQRRLAVVAGRRHVDRRRLRLDRLGRLRLRRLPVPHVHRRRRHLGRPRTGRSATVTAEGETLVQFRALDAPATPRPGRRPSPTPASTVRIDRTAPTARPSPAARRLAERRLGDGHRAPAPSDAAGSASPTTSTAPRPTAAPPGRGPAGRHGRRHRRGRDAGRSSARVDGAGNTSGLGAGRAVRRHTVRIDRTAPADPPWRAARSTWQSVASVPSPAVGATDAAAAASAGYQYRTSTDGGTTWSAGAARRAGAVTAEGETLVQFRSARRAPATPRPGRRRAPTAGSTVRHRPHRPTAPTVSGGSPPGRTSPR